MLRSPIDAATHCGLSFGVSTESLLDTDRLNRWLTLGANFGVLCGLILLVVEINQNSELTRVQIEQSRSESYVNWRRQIALNDNVASILAKIIDMEGTPTQRLEQLNPTERIQARSIIEARFYDYENLYSQYQRGFVSEDYWRERAVPVILIWAPIWNAVAPPDGFVGRRAFKDEVERILQQSTIGNSN